MDFQITTNNKEIEYPFINEETSELDTVNFINKTLSELGVKITFVLKNRNAKTIDLDDSIDYTEFICYARR